MTAPISRRVRLAASDELVCPGPATACSPPLSAGKCARVPAFPAGRVLEDLAGLSDLELLGILRSRPRGSELRGAACELLVSRHRHLVRSRVQRYQRSSEPAEDLIQVGYVGLLKAINNFDPALGGSLAAYAQPCITGEVKRYFRDKGRLVHVTRSVQELVLEAREATRQLTQDLGRVPTESDLARHLGVSGADLREARRAELAFRPSSLDAPVAGRPGTANLADLLGTEDPGMEHMLGMQAVATHWRELPRREQQILVLRFHGDLTQAQIGHLLGISQMHVSRLLAHALGYLRPRLLGLPEHPAAQGSPQPRQVAAGASAGALT
jgi:RNA polymerase sigma-B factor